MTSVELGSTSQLGPFTYRWPDGTEDFEKGWIFTARISGASHQVKHGLGAREVYGRIRVHTVTWLDGELQVEGVESDDYPTTQALISRLRRPGRATARTWSEIPAGYGEFTIVDHRREIEAPYSPNCLAVKIREDDLPAWTLHAWLRSRLPRKPKGPAVMPDHATVSPPALPPSQATNTQAIGRALLAHAEGLAEALRSGATQFTPDKNADAFVRSDAFAFLLAVIADMGIRAERAWAVPYELRERLGHLEPAALAAAPDAVRQAVQQPPKLHRFVNLMPDWFVNAARIILDRYGGDASRLWSDQPTAVEMRRCLEAFPGIGQKKAAMAVEILARDLGKPLRQLEGSDIAYDVHLRRVFLRSGLADRDEVGHMVSVARSLYPERPGALDLPAWDIGRRWCHPSDPDCLTCPLNAVCPRLVAKARTVTGV
jgi:uncharacterized HhH-GPD family protein